ncbi:MAG: iron-sulfur cluster repair di-iron protein, ric [Thermoanaerobacteraceae bacterium]|nr:iron-sulfur cluster repair di-iron protein, ric [Thermoanaerobacteraceae bacterium]
MTTFNQVKARNLEKLEQFVPIVARVHGGTHPEFHHVHRLFNEINEKIRKAGSEKPNLDNEFKELCEVTRNFSVPDDVCETYEAVYNMLAELDKAYQG